MSIKKIFGIIIIISIMAGISLFSSQTAQESDHLSKNIAKEIVVQLGILTEEEAKKDADGIISQVNHIIRKLAHFTIYFLLGLILYIVIYNNIYKPFFTLLIAWTISTIYAGFDEYHQTFVSGRGGQIRDIIIDSSGALLAGVMCVVFLKVILRNKRNNPI